MIIFDYFLNLCYCIVIEFYHTYNEIFFHEMYSVKNCFVFNN